MRMRLLAVVALTAAVTVSLPVEVGIDSGMSIVAMERGSSFDSLVITASVNDLAIVGFDRNGKLEALPARQRQAMPPSSPAAPIARAVARVDREVVPFHLRL